MYNLSMEHGPDCNCYECWWARGQKEVCPTCGSLIENCPCGKPQDLAILAAQGFLKDTLDGLDAYERDVDPDYKLESLCMACKHTYETCNSARQTVNGIVIECLGFEQVE